VTCGIASPQTPDVDLASLPETISQSTLVKPHLRRLAGALGASNSSAPFRKQVMALVVSGLLNKQVGGELGISEITVKAHRGKMLQKMEADSLAELEKMAARLRLPGVPKA
jgi:DNA-binding NarL/FixJ family response regulator